MDTDDEVQTEAQQDQEKVFIPLPYPSHSGIDFVTFFGTGLWCFAVGVMTGVAIAKAKG